MNIFGNSNFLDSINPFSTSGGTPGGALFGKNGLISNPEGAWDNFINGATNEVNSAIAQENLAYQREALEKNLGFQYENLDYQKALQREIFDREDTAYARTIKDMRNAGLNPLMMNGTNGAGEAIQTEAPHQDALHNDLQYQGTGLAQILNQVADIGNKFQDFRIGNQIEKSNDLEIQGKEIENKYKENNMVVEYLNQLEELRNKGIINDDLYRELQHRIDTNYYTSDPKITGEIKGVLGNMGDIAEGAVEKSTEAIKRTGGALKETGNEFLNFLKDKREWIKEGYENWKQEKDKKKNK